ncbi:hypothetical protein, partial [Methanoregula sp.]|uniref:hypothetical protein n=1 Tax=Methanoregula sp. TaxID=2052170 RepID=UPI00260A4791
MKVSNSSEPGRREDLQSKSSKTERPIRALRSRNILQDVSSSEGSSDPEVEKNASAFFDFRLVRRACSSSLSRPSHEGLEFIRT